MLRAFAVHGHRVAVRDGDARWTYTEFAARVARLVSLLRALGLGPGGHALLVSPNTADALLAFHAVPLAGGVIVPLNPAFADDSLHFLAGHADPVVALVDRAHGPRLAARLAELGVPVLEIGTGSGLHAALLDQPPAPLAVPAGLDEHAPISINYTSGTTSDPKGVMLTHRGAFVNLADLLYHLNLRPGDAFLHALTLAHGNGWGAAWAVSAAGATHVALPDLAGLGAALHGGAVTHLCASPAMLAPLTDSAAPRRLARPVTLLLAGTRPPARLLSGLQEQGFAVLHGYGLTETSAVMVLNDPADGPPDAPLTRQGHPMIYGGTVRVILDSGEDAPADGQTPGEVVIRSNQTMRGYYKNPRATRRVLRGGWLHTGDLAVLHPGGMLDILDREGDLLSLRGHPYSSAQIEGVLYRHPSVLEAVVVATRQHSGEDVPTAFVTLQPGAQVQGRELLSFCAPHLPDHALPRRVQIVHELPKTASGKVLKHVLREQAREKGVAQPAD